MAESFDISKKVYDAEDIQKLIAWDRKDGVLASECCKVIFLLFCHCRIIVVNQMRTLYF